MKKKVLIALLLGLCAATTGCSQKSGETKETETVTEADSKAGAETSTEQESETQDSEQESGTQDSEQESEAKDSESDTMESTSEETVAAKTEEPEYRALDYVTLGQYKSLEVTVPSLDVTEEDMQEQFYNDCSTHDKLLQIKEGEVSDGDVTNIDYVGSIDGVEFDGGTDKGVDLTIGSGMFIPGFEEGLIGAAIGEKTDVNVTFPDPYKPNTSMSGKDAVFAVTVNFVKKTPEMTDELVAEISDSKTVEEYRKALEESIRSSKESMQDANKINGILNLLYSGSTINGYPEDVVSYRVADMKSFYAQLAEQYDMDLDTFLQQQFQITEEQMDQQWPTIVKQSMIQELLLKAVAESEKMEVTEEEYNEGLDRYVASTGSESKETLLSIYSETEIRRSILLDKALDFLKENTTVKVEGESETSSESESGSETGEETASTESESEEKPSEADSSETQPESSTEAPSETQPETSTDKSDAE